MSNTDLLTLIDSFKQNHKDAIATFYKEQREVFLGWAGARYDIDKESLLDIYQDSIIVLYQNAIHDKLNHVQSKPEAYLFGIAKNLLLKKNIKSKRTVYVEDISQAINEEIDVDLNYENGLENQEVIKKAMEQLKVNCRKIIRLYYYNNYTMDAISHEMGYENEEVAKSRKYQCMKALRKFINNLK